MPIAFNPGLIEDVAKQRTVLFVGAGVSKWAEPRGGGKFKDWAEFLSAAANNLQDTKIQAAVKKRIKVKDFLIASEVLKNHLQGDWTTLLGQEFQQAANVSRLHKALIALDQRILVTTNFDKLIESAWDDSKPTRYPHVVSKVDDRAFRMFRDGDPYLIKLHGSVDEPQGVVFDKSSYQSAAFSNHFYGDLLHTLLLTHTFIFIGFSMDDPAVSLAVESHAHRFPESRPHYIFLPGSADLAFDELSKTLRKLFVIRYSAKNGHVALAEGLEKLAAEAKSSRMLSTAQST